MYSSSGKHKKEEGFEEAVEMSELKSKLVQHRKQFPGLALPDDPNWARGLLEPDSSDVKVATEAMNEV